MIGDTIPNVGDTGSYMATFISDAGAENYEPLTAVVSLTISKDDSSVIKAPEAIANLKFNGQQQALVTAGEASGGKFQYSLDKQHLELHRSQRKERRKLHRVFQGSGRQ